MPRLSFSLASLRAAFIAALAGVAAPLAGCHDFGDVTGSIPASSAQPADDAKLRAYADELGKRYDSNPGEKTASIEYARALRALTRYNEAVAVIQTAAIKTPKDFDVLGEYGKALADAGQLPQAKDVLSHAYTPDNPQWDVMSVQGAVADRMGDHASAMQFYREALKIAPGEPSVLTNMGLSLAGQAIARGRGRSEASRREPKSRRPHAWRPCAGAGAGGEIRRRRDGRPGRPFA
jgi:Flp pilus assembly protein TadD